MVAAILRRELIGSGRSGRLYAIRAGYLGVLALLVLPTLLSTVREIERAGVRFDAAPGGQSFLMKFGLLQIALVALLGPALAGGSILRERASGTLDVLRASGVDAVRLVTGKFGAQTAVVLAYLVSGAPLMFAGTLMGGVGAELVLLVLLQGASIGVLASAIGLAASALFRRPLAVVLSSYLLLLAVFAVPLVVYAVVVVPASGRVAQGSMNLASLFSVPFALASRSTGRIDAWIAFGSAVPPLLVAALALAAAVAGSRSVRSERAQAVESAGIDFLEGGWLGAGTPRRAPRNPATSAAASRPSRRVQGNPVAWRESNGARRSLGLRVTRLLYVSIGGAVAIHLFVFAVVSGWQGLARAGVLFLAPGTALLAMVAASTSITGERETGSLLLLHASRLGPLDVVIGKIQGLWRFLWPAIVLPLVPGLAFLGIDNRAVVLTALATAVLLLTGTALGVFFSAMCRRSMTAIGGSLAAVVVWVGAIPIAVVAYGGMLLRGNPYSRTALLLDWGLAATNPLVMTKYLADSFGNTPDYLVRLNAVPNTTPPLIGLGFFVLLSLVLLQTAAWRLGREQA